jgi:hypothetical protein
MWGEPYGSTLANAMGSSPRTGKVFYLEKLPGLMLVNPGTSRLPGDLTKYDFLKVKITRQAPSSQWVKARFQSARSPTANKQIHTTLTQTAIG